MSSGHANARNTGPIETMNTTRAWHFPALLSFVAGCVDTIGFVALFNLLTASVTGNITQAGVTLGYVAAGGFRSGLIGKLLALPVFVLGVASTTVILRRIPGGHRAAARLALLMQAAGIFMFMLAGLWAQPIVDADAPSTLLCSMLGVLAMSVQNTGSRLLFTDMAPSTVMTGNITQLVIDGMEIWRTKNAASLGSARVRVSKVLPLVSGFSAGALAGGLGYHFFGFISLTVAMAALVLAWAAAPKS